MSHSRIIYWLTCWIFSNNNLTIFFSLLNGRVDKIISILSSRVASLTKVSSTVLNNTVNISFQ